QLPGFTAPSQKFSAFCLVLQIVHQRGARGDEVSSAATPTPKIAADFTGLSCFFGWSDALAAKVFPCCCTCWLACRISVAPVVEPAAHRRGLCAVIISGV